MAREQLPETLGGMVGKRVELFTDYTGNKNKSMARDIDDMHPQRTSNGRSMEIEKAQVPLQRMKRNENCTKI